MSYVSETKEDVINQLYDMKDSEYTLDGTKFVLEQIIEVVKKLELIEPQTNKLTEFNVQTTQKKSSN